MGVQWGSSLVLRRHAFYTRVRPFGGSPPVTGRSVTEFGVTGNGTNETVALQAAVDAMTAGDTLITPSGMNVRHSGNILLRRAGVRFHGAGARWTATNSLTQSVQITTANVTIDGLPGNPFILENIDAATVRSPGTGTQKITIEAVSGSTVRDMESINSAATGIRCRGASFYTVQRLTVRHSWADGIHSTNGSHDGQITDCVVEENGDDWISIVSYNSDPTICHDIVVTGCSARDNYHGRGFTVVGGDRVKFENCTGTISNGAGIYVVAEDPTSWDTQGITNITYRGITLNQANSLTASTYKSRVTDSTPPNHGAVLVLNQQPSALQNIWLENFTLIDTPSARSRSVRIDSSGTTSVPCLNVLARGVDIIGTAPTTNLTSGATPSANYLAQTWRKGATSGSLVALPDSGSSTSIPATAWF
jgi:hypothetical protein